MRRLVDANVQDNGQGRHCWRPTTKVAKAICGQRRKITRSHELYFGHNRCHLFAGICIWVPSGQQLETDPWEEKEVTSGNIPKSQQYMPIAEASKCKRSHSRWNSCFRKTTMFSTIHINVNPIVPKDTFLLSHQLFHSVPILLHIFLM